MENSKGKYKNKIITVPNILSFFRLCLIPVIYWQYCVKKNYLLTTCTLTVSGMTDIVDGIIARKFDMVSDFGKAFDPVADKLTQIVMLLCLVTRFPFMLIPLVILITKEILAATLNMITIKKTGKVMGAVWHGKLNTVLLYSMMIIHLIWYNIPAVASNILIGICTVMMLISSVLYTIRNVSALTAKEENAENE